MADSSKPFHWQNSPVVFDSNSQALPVPSSRCPAGWRVSSGPFGEWHLAGLSGSANGDGRALLIYRRLLIREGAKLPQIPDEMLVLLDAMMEGRK